MMTGRKTSMALRAFASRARQTYANVTRKTPAPYAHEAQWMRAYMPERVARPWQVARVDETWIVFVHPTQRLGVALEVINDDRSGDAINARWLRIVVTRHGAAFAPTWPELQAVERDLLVAHDDRPVLWTMPTNTAPGDRVIDSVTITGWLKVAGMNATPVSPSK